MIIIFHPKLRFNSFFRGPRAVTVHFWGGKVYTVSHFSIKERTAGIGKGLSRCQITMFDLNQLLTTPALHDWCNDQIVILIQDPWPWSYTLKMTKDPMKSRPASSNRIESDLTLS